MDFKTTYDTRGRQRNVLRLASFDREGLAHIITYRILSVLSIITGIVVLYGLISGSAYVMSIAEILVALVWLLFGIELYSVYKAFGIIMTKGIVFGNLNKSFMEAEVRMKPWYGIVRAGAPILIAVWYALFAVFVVVVLL